MVQIWSICGTFLGTWIPKLGIINDILKTKLKSNILFIKNLKTVIAVDMENQPLEIYFNGRGDSKFIKKFSQNIGSKLSNYMRTARYIMDH